MSKRATGSRNKKKCVAAPSSANNRAKPNGIGISRRKSGPFLTSDFVAVAEKNCTTRETFECDGWRRTEERTSAEEFASFLEIHPISLGQRADCDTQVSQRGQVEVIPFQPLHPAGSSNIGDCLIRKPLPTIQNKDFSQMLTRVNTTKVAPVFRSPTMMSMSSFRSQPPTDIGRLRFRDGKTPIPSLRWANKDEVWNLICWKDNIYSRDPHMLQRHLQITANMRAILFEWLSDVCEHHKLHRETYYLAMDFVDRYLAKDRDLPRSRLQLVGITALFVAAKMEEIYPPQVSQFASVTDDSCSVEDILSCELAMLKMLNWALSPVTTNHWLTIYLQIAASHCFLDGPKHVQDENRDIVYSQFYGSQLLRLAQITDLCSLDIGSLRFPSSVLAASAFVHVFEPEQLALFVSGYKRADLETCVAWMTPFVQALEERRVIDPRVFTDIPLSDMHNIQTRSVDMNLLNRAHCILNEQRSSPVFVAKSCDIYPTPPQSDERPLAFVNY